MEHTPVGKVCAFCGTVGTEDSSFAGGLGALMCSDCLTKYAEIFASDQRREEIRKAPWDMLSDDEILQTIPSIIAVQDQMAEFLRHWIKVARERGHTWADIGGILGVSRQAAWQRFHADTE